MCEWRRSLEWSPWRIYPLQESDYVVSKSSCMCEWRRSLEWLEPHAQLKCDIGLLGAGQILETNEL